ncbi:MAG: tetratricopeptide repeat protein [Nitrospirae bacterium]|nr:tetratricopeptide repeat protein [Nitrospirota bacterium]
MKRRIKISGLRHFRKLLSGAPEFSSTGALAKVKAFVICALFLTRAAYGIQTGDLIKELSYPDWKVRYQAALTLGEQRNEKAVTPLVKALSDKERIVRDSAALALTRIGGKKVEEVFLQDLFSRNDETRSRAALALGRMRVERAEEPLLKLLPDKNWLVRWSASLALGMIGEEQAVPALEVALKDGYYDKVSGKYPVREAAGSALARIKSKREKDLVFLESDLRKNPGDIGKALTLAEAYLGKEKEKKAIRLLEKLMKLNLPNEEKYRARIRFDLAYGYGQVGKWRKSRKLFRELVERYPDFKDADKALYSLAILYYKLGEKNKTVQTVQKLIDRYPRSEVITKAKELLEKTGNR